MAYLRISSQHMSETELRALWASVYCDPSKPIFTFNSIRVRFHVEMFDHAFYESYNRRERDKSILSLNRCQKMLWIKDTLEDPSACLKQGWDRDKKKYVKERRVALVKNNYIVIIQLVRNREARFISAYEINEPENLNRILASPDWEPIEMK